VARRAQRQRKTVKVIFFDALRPTLSVTCSTAEALPAFAKVCVNRAWSARVVPLVVAQR